jgi:hypothetical protein
MIHSSWYVKSRNDPENVGARNSWMMKLGKKIVALPLRLTCHVCRGQANKYYLPMRFLNVVSGGRSHREKSKTIFLEWSLQGTDFHPLEKSLNTLHDTLSKLQLKNILE